MRFRDDDKTKIKKILLYDDCDEWYMDLITFKEYTTRKAVYNAIQECKNDKPGEYTNEDIYDYLDKYIGIDTIEFLDYDRFDY